MGLSAQLDFFEVRALVFFLSNRNLHRECGLIIWVAMICTKISADEQSFGVQNHDVVTTPE